MPPPAPSSPAREGPAAGPTRLGADVAAFLQSTVGIVLASRNETLLPSLARCLGCRVDLERGSVTVFLDASENRALLDDIRRHRVAAAVFSRPSSHRTVQLKGFDAHECALDEQDLRTVARYAQAFDAELDSIGFGGGYARALLAHRPGRLTGVRFTVAEAFEQTPGPGAGERLKSP